MAEIVELAPDQSPPHTEKGWVKVHITEHDVFGSAGDVITSSYGITFKTHPGEPMESLSIANAQDEADKRGIKTVYVQRDAPGA